MSSLSIDIRATSRGLRACLAYPGATNQKWSTPRCTPRTGDRAAINGCDRRRKTGPVFPSDATKDGVHGEYTPRQAIERLFQSGRLTCPALIRQQLLVSGCLASKAAADPLKRPHR